MLQMLTWPSSLASLFQRSSAQTVKKRYVIVFTPFEKGVPTHFYINCFFWLPTKLLLMGRPLNSGLVFFFFSFLLIDPWGTLKRFLKPFWCWTWHSTILVLLSFTVFTTDPGKPFRWYSLQMPLFTYKVST